MTHTRLVGSTAFTFIEVRVVELVALWTCPLTGGHRSLVVVIQAWIAIIIVSYKTIEKATPNGRWSNTVSRSPAIVANRLVRVVCVIAVCTNPSSVISIVNLFTRFHN